MSGCKGTPSASTEAIAIVLAGGRSRRMGRDKALLEFTPGESLLDHQRKRLREVASRVWVSGDYPQYESVKDDAPSLGPLGGLAAVARRAPENARLLFVPVDMPFLPLTLLRELVASEARYAHFVTSELPAVFCNDQAFANCLHSLLRDPLPANRSLRGLFASLPEARVLEAKTSSEIVFANLNRPTDLAEAWRLHRSLERNP